ncbi:F-box protein CPR1-like [Papaver somniferum]|uniref:F-box protein CPR1-like n=1 Tax=Papaver somniferum TaxID=3469 RepID=UPI000E6F8AEF|nr:F-box protein CPR1-like [Papaver somniferum]
MHLGHAQRNNSSLMFTSYDESNKQTKVLRSVGYDTLSSSSSSEIEFDVTEAPYSDFDLLCSCNGLVCLKCNDKTTHFICLWNPATTEHMKIPKSPNEYALKDIRLYALGYDKKTDDYKLIVVVEFGVIGSYLVDVYTLKSNSWNSSSQILPYYMYPLWVVSWVLVNEILHWIFRSGHCSWLIICLDINEEKFEEFQLPKEPLKNKCLCMAPGVLEGCLCVLFSFMADFEVWVMQDYGFPESWTKRYTIYRKGNNIYDHDNLSLLWSFRGGVLLLRVWAGDLVYDTKDSSGRKVNNGVSLMLHPAYSYVESLVSPYSGNNVGQR